MVRMPKAYPVYDDVYRDNVEVIRRWFEEHAPNVHPVGRNGMHKYNNQDHSMYTAMLTVENIHGAHHDIWAVNVEEEYHEPTRPWSSTDAQRAASGTPARGPVGPGRAAPTRAGQGPGRVGTAISPGRRQGPERHRLVAGGTGEPAGSARWFPWWMAGRQRCGSGSPAHLRLGGQVGAPRAGRRLLLPLAGPG